MSRETNAAPPRLRSDARQPFRGRNQRVWPCTDRILPRGAPHPWHAGPEATDGRDLGRLSGTAPRHRLGRRARCSLLEILNPQPGASPVTRDSPARNPLPGVDGRTETSPSTDSARAYHTTNPAVFGASPTLQLAQLPVNESDGRGRLARDSPARAARLRGAGGRDSRAMPPRTFALSPCRGTSDRG